MAIAVGPRAEPSQWIALQETLLPEELELVEHFWLVGPEDALELSRTDFLPALVSEAHDFVECIVLDLLAKHLLAAVETEPVLALELDGDLVRDRVRVLHDLLNVADGALFQLSFRGGRGSSGCI